VRRHGAGLGSQDEKSAGHNHLTRLQEQGYVVKQDDEKYRFGLKFLDIGGYVRKSIEFYQVAEVQSLAAETGELANLLVEE